MSGPCFSAVVSSFGLTNNNDQLKTLCTVCRVYQGGVTFGPKFCKTDLEVDKLMGSTCFKCI